MRLLRHGHTLRTGRRASRGADPVGASAAAVPKSTALDPPPACSSSSSVDAPREHAAKPPPPRSGGEGSAALIASDRGLRAGGCSPATTLPRNPTRGGGGGGGRSASPAPLAAGGARAATQPRHILLVSDFDGIGAATLAVKLLDADALAGHVAIEISKVARAVANRAHPGGIVINDIKEVT